MFVNPDLSLGVNPYSWTSNATVVWVDQPSGTGFSYGGINHDETQGLNVVRNNRIRRSTPHPTPVGDDMLDFVLGFLAKYPQYAALDFYVFGESYAGHYVPVVAEAVFSRGKTVNLKGAAIGIRSTAPWL